MVRMAKPDVARRGSLVGAALLALAAVGSAQIQSQLFQLNSITIYRNGIDLDWYIMPGSELAANAFARIDTNGDGAVSEAEGKAYAKRAFRDVTLTVDGKPQTLLIRHVSISDRKQMLTGLGSVDYLVYVVLPERLGRRTLVFENRHRRALSTFKTATLNDPADRSIRILNPRQSAGGARLSLTYIVGKAPTFP